MATTDGAADLDRLTLSEPQDEAEAPRSRIDRFRTSLGRSLVAKQERIDLGVRVEVHRGPDRKPWVEGHCTHDDLRRVNRYLTPPFGRSSPAGNGDGLDDRRTFFPAEAPEGHGVDR